MRNAAYRARWDRVLQQWTETLDLVIWLDAPDDVLIERVQTRGRQHRMKNAAADDAAQFLSRYRACYQEIIATWAANGGPRVLRCNTQQESLDQTPETILRDFKEFG